MIRSDPESRLCSGLLRSNYGILLLLRRAKTCWPVARALDRRPPAGFGRRPLTGAAGLARAAADWPCSSARLERALCNVADGKGRPEVGGPMSVCLPGNSVLDIVPNIGIYAPTPCHQGRFAKRFSRRAGSGGLRPVLTAHRSRYCAHARVRPRVRSHTSGTTAWRRSNPVGTVCVSSLKGRRRANRERTCVSLEPPLLTGTPSSRRLFLKPVYPCR